MAKRGARIIMLCRNKDKAEEAVREIKEASGSQTVQFLPMDLASLKSIRQCAEQLLETEEKIDYLINNAGNHSPNDH